MSFVFDEITLAHLLPVLEDTVDQLAVLGACRPSRIIRSDASQVRAGFFFFIRFPDLMNRRSAAARRGGSRGDCAASTPPGS